MRTLHLQWCTVMVLWSVAMLPGSSCCEAFATTGQRTPSTARRPRITTTTTTTLTTILPRSLETTQVGPTMGFSVYRSAVPKMDSTLPSSHHPPNHPLLRRLQLGFTRYFVSSWGVVGWPRIRPKFWNRRWLATATLVLFSLVVPRPSFVCHASEQVDAVKVERIILEPLDGGIHHPTTNQQVPHGTTVVKPLVRLVVGAGASTLAFRSMRRPHRVGSNETSTSMDSRTIPPLDDTESTTIQLHPPPKDTESSSLTTTTTEKETIQEMATARTSAGGGVLEHDPRIEQEIQDHLDLAREWTLLHQPARQTTYPLRDPQFLQARRQPKSVEEQERLARKYASIQNLSERAYQVLLDLGMIEKSKPTVDMSKFEGIIDMTMKKE
jgi:hypothetical protein